MDNLDCIKKYINNVENLTDKDLKKYPAVFVEYPTNWDSYIQGLKYAIENTGYLEGYIEDVRLSSRKDWSYSQKMATQCGEDFPICQLSYLYGLKYVFQSILNKEV